MDLLIVPNTIIVLHLSISGENLRPVEYEHIKAKYGPGKSVDHGSIERLFVRKHPGLLRQGEVEIVPVPVPEENVLQSRAPSLVGFSKGNLQIFFSYNETPTLCTVLPVF